MLYRDQVGLLASAVLSIAAIVVGADLPVGSENDNVGWIVGIPVVLLGVALFAAAIVGWQREPRYAQWSCTIWAGVLLTTACAIGGADDLVGIALAIVAIAMGALSVWVTG